MGRDQQPVALVLLDPKDFGVAEVVLGIVIGAEEQGLGILGPVLPIGAGGVHDALLALAAVAGVVMAGVEKVVEPIRVLHDAAGAQGGIGVGHHAVREHHAVILVAAEIVGGILIDGVVALAVAVGVKEVIELQRAVLGHKGHHIAHVAALRRGIELIVHRLIGLVRERLIDGLFRDFFRRFPDDILRRRGGGPAAAGREQKRGEQQHDDETLCLLHRDFLLAG